MFNVVIESTDEYAKKKNQSICEMQLRKQEKIMKIVSITCLM